MAPRKPIEQDMVDGLRDLREQFSKLSRSVVVLAESIDERFDSIEEGNLSYRKKRVEEEVEQARILYEKKSASLEDQKNGPDTQKLKTIAAEAVKTEMGAKQIDWGKLWREKVVPALVTTLAVALMLGLLAALMPGIIIPALQKAFGG